VAKVEVPERTVMHDGATVAWISVGRKIRFDWEPSDLTGGLFYVVNGYIPSIKLPTVEMFMPVHGSLDLLIRHVTKVLHRLKQAGC
jgi:hypothetical protein